MIKTKKKLKYKIRKKSIKGGSTQEYQPTVQNLTRGIEHGRNAKFLRKARVNTISVKIKFIITDMIPYGKKLNKNSLYSSFSPDSYSLTYVETGEEFKLKLYGDLNFVYDETTTYDVFNFLLFRYLGFESSYIKRNNVILEVNNIKYYAVLSRIINALLCEDLIVREQEAQILSDGTVRKEIYFSQSK